MSTLGVEGLCSCSLGQVLSVGRSFLASFTVGVTGGVYVAGGIGVVVVTTIAKW